MINADFRRKRRPDRRKFLSKFLRSAPSGERRKSSPAAADPAAIRVLPFGQKRPQNDLSVFVAPAKTPFAFPFLISRFPPLPRCFVFHFPFLFRSTGSFRFSESCKVRRRSAGRRLFPLGLQAFSRRVVFCFFSSLRFYGRFSAFRRLSRSHAHFSLLTCPAALTARKKPLPAYGARSGF